MYLSSKCLGSENNSSDDEPLIHQAAKHPQVTKILRIILERCDGEETAATQSLNQTTTGTDYISSYYWYFFSKNLKVKRNMIVTLPNRQTDCWKGLEWGVKSLRGIIIRRVRRWNKAGTGWRSFLLPFTFLMSKLAPCLKDFTKCHKSFGEKPKKYS